MYTSQLEFQWLPESLQTLRITRCPLKGTVAFESLPEITDLSLGSNKLSGGVKTSDIPRTVKLLDLSSNLFRGTLDLCDLPSSMEKADFSDNAFQGSIDDPPSRRHFPPSMCPTTN